MKFTLGRYQAEWPRFLAHYHGTKLARVLLTRIVPVELNDGVLTLLADLRFGDAERVEQRFGKEIETWYEGCFSERVRVVIKAMTVKPGDWQRTLSQASPFSELPVGREKL